jgi:hypothetical protein
MAKIVGSIPTEPTAAICFICSAGEDITHPNPAPYLKNTPLQFSEDLLNFRD